MAFGGAMRYNTAVSASDSRIASMNYAAKVAENRLARSMQRSKWYKLSEAERSEILFPAPKKLHANYYDVTPEQQRQCESHFKGEGMQWRPPPLSATIDEAAILAQDPNNPARKPPPGGFRVWHAGGRGFEGI